jgi:hypothetical protein
MMETCEAKDKELIAIKAELRRLNIAHTLLVNQHAVLSFKTSQSGAEGYSQLQKDYKDLQAKYNAKEEECTLFEQQCNFLSEAFQEQSMVLPSGGPTSAHASSSIGDDLDLEGPLESLAREKLAHDNSGLNASWGNFRKPESVHDDGWGSTPGNIRKPASIHDDSNLPAPSPNTIDGSHTGLSDSDNSRTHQSGTVYGQNMNSKGPGKGSWKGWNQGKNKRGRDQRDDSRGHMNAERDSRQKTWQIDGRKTAESWFQSTTLQKHMRNIPLHSAKALRSRLIRANNEYQLNMKHVSFEHWNTRGNQPTAHDPEAGLRKELGMPPKPSVSPHFYFKSALWHCNQAINAVVNTETGEEDRGNFVWRQEFNDPKYDNDISQCQVQDNLLPDNIKQLRDTYSKVFEDYKTALHYLALQRKETKYYEARRSNFYHICIVMNGKRPTHTFLGKELHIQMKKSFMSDKRQSRSIETPAFTRLFDEAYKEWFTNIKIDIERFAAHRTPLEYTQLHTPDITNLYYYIDTPEDGSAEQGAF